jgi:hypothetical protein
MASKPQTPGRVPRNALLTFALLSLLALAETAYADLPFPDAITITLGDLVQTYDGEPKAVTVSTDPQDMPVSVIYDGSLEPPSEPGSYTVWGIVEDPLFPVIAKDTLTISPVLTNVSVPLDGTYGTGELLEFDIAYCGNVSVLTNHGVPSLSLRIGDSLVDAAYAGGEQTNLLVFTYTVQPGDNGAVLMPETISLNDASIQDSGGHDVATYFLPPSTAQVVVDTTIVPPLPPADILQVQLLGSAAVRLTVTGTPNATYVLQATDDLLTPAWAAIGVAQADINGVGILDVPIQAGSQFFRTMRQMDTGEPPPR